MSLSKQTVAWHDLLSSATETVKSALQSKGQHLEMTSPQQKMLVHVDPTRIEQLITNLIENASKFTPSQGHVWIKTEVENRDLILTVKDQGVGLKPEIRDSIFEPFVQAETSLARELGGLGLGLSLVKLIADLHAGTVEVSSEGPGLGTEFAVRLPDAVTDIRPIGELPAIPIENFDTNKLPTSKVLLVEDSSDLALIMNFMLEKIGFDVTILENWEGVLGALEKEDFDVVLLDIGLPVVNGYDIAKMIRANSRYDSLPLIALTGYGTAEHKMMAEAAGFDMHLTKPVSADRLAEAITSLLKRSSC